MFLTIHKTTRCVLTAVGSLWCYALWLPHTAYASPLSIIGNLSTISNHNAIPTRTAEIPNFQVLESEHARIGKIYIRINNVFDIYNPLEDRSLFRLTNKLHIKSKPSVVRSQLLFKSGDPFSYRILRESERVLRANVIFYDAVVRPIHYSDGYVDIEVFTRDVWTLKPSIHFSRKGGSNNTGFSIEETNLLGYGKKIKMESNSTIDRNIYLLEYKDSNLFSSRNTLLLGYSDNSDGLSRRLLFSRPFYALDSHWTYGVKTVADERIDQLYFNGEVENQFRQKVDNYEAFLGYSEGLKDNWTVRWSAGLAYKNHRFFITPDTQNPNALPQNRTLAYPWLSLQMIENRFNKVRRLNTINRVEDLNFGKEFTLRAGWSSQEFGADRSNFLVDFSFKIAASPRKNHIVAFTTSASGRLASGRSENILISESTKYYLPNGKNKIFFAQLDLDWGHQIDLEKPLYLGGASGLRGYPLRLQRGDLRELAHIEQRFYSDWHILQLAYLGGALFYDVGRARYAEKTTGSSRGFLQDVGFGLRAISSRAGRGIVLHMDIAIPLDRDENIDIYQLLVSGERTF